MLESISWSEFFGFVGLALALYYVIAGLLLYGEEIKAKLIQRRPSIIRSSSDPRQKDTNESISLIGALAPQVEQTVLAQTVSSSEIEFRENSQLEAAEPLQTPVENSLATTLTGLFEDVNSVAEVITNNSKEELADMFRTLLERYPHLIGYRDSLSQFIVNTCSKYCSYSIELQEVNSWWPGQIQILNQ
jgi:hypothetical protein